jgi:predicted PurR-regulated permease PerM
MKSDEIKTPVELGERERPRSTMASLVLVSGLVGVLLYFAHAVFVPIALSILFALLLSAPVEGLNQKGLPRSASALCILLIFLSLVGGVVNLLWNPAQAWLQAAPQTSQIIQRKTGPAARFLQRIEAVSARASHLTDTKGPSTTGAPVPTPTDNSGDLWVATQGALVGGLTVIILTLFLLAAGPPVLARMSATFAENTHATHVLRVIEAIRGEVGRYYATIALINVGLAVATCLLMMLIGMPNPVLWGAVAGLLNFIPYVGSATTFVILTIVAFVSFDGIGHVLATSGGYLLLATIEGQVIQPLLVGQRLELNPIIVFLALWFGGWFWGIPGIILAIPTLVALKVAAEHSQRGTALVEFLSPSKAKRVKQRSTAVKAPRQTA